MPPALVEKNSDKNDDRQDRERQKAVEIAFGQIEKQFGKGAIMRLGQKGAIQPIDSIPTGSISIDYALGVGGVPEVPGDGGVLGVWAEVGAAVGWSGRGVRWHHSESASDQSCTEADSWHLLGMWRHLLNKPRCG